ncbi:MAG: glycosyltransferase, partial [Pseudomonadota bacterium]
MFGNETEVMTIASWFLVVGLCSLLGWVYLLAWHSGFWRVKPKLDRLPRDSTKPLPEVVAVVPARNEVAHVSEALRSLLGQTYAGRLSVILVDDHSDDLTRRIAQSVGASSGRSLRVISASPLPPGWSGKLWAVAAGLEHAREHFPDARYVLLTDADIAHDRANLARLIAKAEADQLDLVSLMVRLHCTYFWERLLIPAFVFFFRKLYPFQAVNQRARKVAAAAGGCMLVRREALERVGGIESIHDQLIDDVALGAQLKHQPRAHTGRIWLGHTDRTVSLRQQPRLCDLWAMVVRCADKQLGHSLPMLALTVVGMLVLYIWPVVAVFSWSSIGQPALVLLGSIIWLSIGLAYWPTVRLYRL